MLNKFYMGIANFKWNAKISSKTNVIEFKASILNNPQSFDDVALKAPTKANIYCNHFVPFIKYHVCDKL